MTQEGTNYINELKAMFCTLAFALTKRDDGSMERHLAKEKMTFYLKKITFL